MHLDLMQLAKLRFDEVLDLRAEHVFFCFCILKPPGMYL